MGTVHGGIVVHQPVVHRLSSTANAMNIQPIRKEMDEAPSYMVIQEESAEGARSARIDDMVFEECAEIVGRFVKIIK